MAFFCVNDQDCNVSIGDVELPPAGNGTCDTSWFAELSRSDGACQAGCCLEGECACRAGFFGDRCDVEF